MHTYGEKAHEKQRQTKEIINIFIKCWRVVKLLLDQKTELNVNRIKLDVK